MGFIQKDAFRTMIITYLGLILGYINKGVLFVFILSTEEIGLINLILSVGFLFAQLSNLGAINAILKFLPFFKGNEDQKQGFLLLNLLFVFGGILFFSAVAVLLQGKVIEYYSLNSALFVDYYFWIIPIGIANVFFLVFESYLRALYKNILAVFVYEFILRIAITFILILLWNKWIDFNQFLIIHCLIYFIPSLTLLLYLFYSDDLRFKKSTFKISKKFRKIILSFGLYSYSNTLGTLVVLAMDGMMIAYFVGLKATGIYTTVIYLTSALQIPYKSLMRVSGPLIPQYWKEKNMQKMQDLYQKVSSISLIIALYMFMLVWFSRIELFSFFPREYMEGIPVFLFLMVGRLVDMYFGLNGIIFVNSKKYKYEIIFTVVMVVTVYFMNCWLIPVYGSSGAAMATGFAVVVYNIGRLLFVYFVYHIHPFSINQIKSIFLFALITVGFELTPAIFSNHLIEILFNGFLVSVLFLGTIYAFRLEPEINNYLKNGKNFIIKKLKP